MSNIECKFAANDYTTTTTGTTTCVLLAKGVGGYVAVRAPGKVPCATRIASVIHKRSRISYTIIGSNNSSPSIADKDGVYTAIATSGHKSKRGRLLRVSKKGNINHIAEPKLSRPMNGTTVGRIPQRVVAQRIRRIYQVYSFRKALRVLVSIPSKRTLTRHAFGPELKVIKKVSVLKAAKVIRPVDDRTLGRAVHIRLHRRHTRKRAVTTISPKGCKLSFVRRACKCSLSHDIGYDGFVNRAVSVTTRLKFYTVLLAKRVKGLVGITKNVVGARSRRKSYQVRLLTTTNVHRGMSLRYLGGVLSYIAARRTLTFVSTRNGGRSIVRSVVGGVSFCLGGHTTNQLRVTYVICSGACKLLKVATGTRRLLEELL